MRGKFLLWIGTDCQVPAGHVPGGTSPMTAIPCAVMAELVASGQCDPGPGVHSVDTAIDPDRFFAALGPYLLDPAGKPTGAPLVLVHPATCGGVGRSDAVCPRAGSRWSAPFLIELTQDQ